MATLSEDELRADLRGLPGWETADGSITKEYTLPSFREAISFVGRIADLAEAADHHPDIDIRFRRVGIVLSTHSEGGVTLKDIALARQIESASG